MFSVDRALLGHNVPAAVWTLDQFFHLVVLNHLCTALTRCLGIGPNGTGGIDITLAVRPQSAQNAIDVHNWALFLNLSRGHQVHVFDTNGLERPICALQPLPAIWRAGDCDTAGHVQANILAAFFLNFRQQIEGIAL